MSGGDNDGKGCDNDRLEVLKLTVSTNQTVITVLWIENIWCYLRENIWYSCSRWWNKENSVEFLTFDQNLVVTIASIAGCVLHCIVSKMFLTLNHHLPPGLKYFLFTLFQLQISWNSHRVPELKINLITQTGHKQTYSRHAPI